MQLTVDQYTDRQEGSAPKPQNPNQSTRNSLMYTRDPTVDRQEGFQSHPGFQSDRRALSLTKPLNKRTLSLPVYIYP